MNTRLVKLLFLVLIISFPASAVQAVTGLPVVRIGIIVDGPWQRDSNTPEIFKKEIRDMTSGEFDVTFPEDKQIIGNWTTDSVNKALDTLFSDKTTDIILTLGAIGSHEVCLRKDLKKPVVAPFIIDTKIQGLPYKNNTSGVKNLSYIDALKSFEKDVETFRQIVPFKHLTVLADNQIVETIPALRDFARALSEKNNYNLELVEVGSSAEVALQKLSPETEAVLVTELKQFNKQAFQQLTDELIKRKLPSYSYKGIEEVEMGILAGLAPAAGLEHLARSVAINVQDILRGEKASSLPVDFDPGERLTINMATARAIDVYPSWDILTKADLINEEDTVGAKELTLEIVVNEALMANLHLASAKRSVEAGRQSVYESRSTLLPQISIGSQARMIDDDRAEAYLGLLPEKQWTGSADASQLIYSDKAWSNYTVQKYLQAGREEDYEALRQDIIQIAATSYLNYLRSKAIENIQKDNLRLTRENLERAQVRLSAGIAGPDEVYRWESEVAGSRQLVLAAESFTMDALSSLNRILNRPQDDMINALEADYKDPAEFLKNKKITQYIDNDKSLRTFRDFMIQEGLLMAPELRQIDAAIAANERVLTASKRAFWIPDVSIKGNVTELFDESGAGSNITGPTETDDTAWTAGVYATLPLFNSGGKVSTMRRSREELAKLRFDHDATAELIEERIRHAVHLIRASYPSIWLSKDAAVAANKNLTLVTDSYTRGIKSIIDLLDAQNQSLVADQKAVNAVYDFMIDLMSLQRSVGYFVMFENEQAIDEWFKKVDAFFVQK
ncbi:MAG: TolC family protein [Desulfobacterales bacterium]|nr:TolC family protein [Desulfobacterales bacterium]